MAGDWIKIEHVTPDKPEVIAMAEFLKMDQDAVFGKLCRLWIWADQQTLNGNAYVTRIALPKSFIDRLAAVTGFAEAMLKAGWLTPAKNGFSFPNFDRHNGKTAKSRALTYDRVKRKRNAASVTKALPETEKRQRQRREGETPLPPSLDSPDFRAVWSEWKTHRREIGHALKPTTERRQLAKCEALGPDRAAAALRHSIEGGYQGIFEPGGNGKSKKTSAEVSGHQWTKEELEACGVKTDEEE